MSVLGAAILQEWNDRELFDGTLTQEECQEAMAEGIAVPVSLGSTPLASTAPAPVASVAVIGVGTSAARADHVHAAPWSLATAPATAHAWDVEFDSGSLPSGWAIDTGNSVGAPDVYSTLTTADKFRHSLNTWRPSWLMFQPTNTQALIYPVGRGSLTFPSNIFVWARLSVMAKRGTVVATTNNQASLGLQLSADGTTTNSTRIWINETETGGFTAQFDVVNAGVITATNDLAVIGTASTQDRIHHYEYVGIQKLGTTYHGWLFTDAGNPFYMGSGTMATSLGHAQIICSDGGTSSPGSALMGVDFIRFSETADWLP
jgi:hypothetical protein